MRLCCHPRSRSRRASSPVSNGYLLGYIPMTQSITIRKMRGERTLSCFTPACDTSTVHSSILSSALTVHRASSVEALRYSSHGVWDLRLCYTEGRCTLSKAFLTSMKFVSTDKALIAEMFSMICRRAKIWSQHDLPPRNPSCFCCNDGRLSETMLDMVLY